MTGQTRAQRVAALPASVALAGVLLAALFLLLTPHVARAGGVVTNCNETGLRQAMAGGGSVTFSCGAPVTITLASQVVITQNTTLDGGTLGLVTISGDGVTRLFTTTAGVMLQVYNLTLSNGYEGSDGGGALHLAGHAIISQSVLSHNGGAFSGAIDTTAPLTIVNSTFHHNFGFDYGGAIGTMAELWVADSVFHDNESGLGAGGAIVAQGALWVGGSEFYSNTADTSGGAIATYTAGHITMSQFYHNHADSSGGAIHNSGELWMSNSDIYSNTTFGQGGGILSNPTLHLGDSRIYDNAAVNGGGGLFSDGTLEVSGSAIYSNTALQGGGIEAYGRVTLLATRLDHNAGAESGGGALLGVNGVNEIVLYQVEIDHNRVTGDTGFGGGLHLEGGGLNATLTNVEIHDNQVISSGLSSGGGGLAIEYWGAVTLVNSAVYGNAALKGSGGGILATAAPTLTLINTAVYSNQASQAGSGGGIYAQYIGIAGSTDLVLSNTTVSGNFANLGAGVFSDSGNDPARIEYTTIYSNNGVSGINLVGPALLHGTVIGRVLVACAGGQGVFCGAIVAGPTGQNCVGAITSAGHNLDDDGTCHLTATGDVSNTAALLAPLAWNGGFSLTHAPLPGSPAIDTADPGQCPNIDQRGGQRPADGDGVSGARCDMGAYEFAAIIARLFLPVLYR